MKGENVDMTMYVILGRHLKEARESKHMSLQQLSDALRIPKSKSTLKRYEDGKARCSIGTLKSICGVLGLDYAYLLKQVQTEAALEQVDESTNITLTKDEIALVYDYRNAPPMMKEAASALLKQFVDMGNEE